MGSSPKFKRFLFLSLFFLFLCLIGLLQIKEKAGLPFTLDSSGSKLVISNKNENSILKKGDIFLLIENHRFTSVEEIEVLLDGKKPGEQVTVKYKRSGVELT